jgi:hypothetical protein
VLHEARKGAKERLRAAARKGDRIVVLLTRGSKHQSWGLEFNEKTMELAQCTAGSPAARNATVGACVGLVLVSIDGADVCNTVEVMKAIKGCSKIQLSFHPNVGPPSVPHDKVAQSPPFVNVTQLSLVDRNMDNVPV